MYVPALTRDVQLRNFPATNDTDQKQARALCLNSDSSHLSHFHQDLPRLQIRYNFIYAASRAKKQVEHVC